MAQQPNQQSAINVNVQPQQHQQTPATSNTGQLGNETVDPTLTEEMTIKQMLEENAHLIDNLLQYQSSPMEGTTLPSMNTSLKQLYKNILFVSRYADQNTQEEANGLPDVKDNEIGK
uniref:SSXT domain-containing protein n=1 Tax=Parastrongyloides trichosuri TaxID=131310 RepID=A0A0N4ZFV4_PARTI